MTDLGTINGIPYSEADFIDDKTQIVGNSFNCDFSTIDAFLLENDSIVDLNSLISHESPIHLAVASYIDDQGEIVAIGVLPNGGGRAVLLIPCDENHAGIEGCDYSMVDVSSVVPQTIYGTGESFSGALSPSFLPRMSRHRFPGRAFGPRN